MRNGDGSFPGGVGSKPAASSAAITTIKRASGCKATPYSESSKGVAGRACVAVVAGEFVLGAVVCAVVRLAKTARKISGKAFLNIWQIAKNLSRNRMGYVN